jgi:hypothetical protein
MEALESHRGLREEQENGKRSRRRIRDLLTVMAAKNLSANKIGCARISITAGAQAPQGGRIHQRKTNLVIAESLSRRTAGPYIWVIADLPAADANVGLRAKSGQEALV